ncbi:MAG: serine/threonine protein phosphatase [Deltaproteobacteria bacterium]|nr:serine/threonine protein phosphatase [Deltaproteobacteria bacterium]
MIDSGAVDSKFRQIQGPASRIFAVGDIHGCRRELELLLEFLISKEKLSDQDGLIFIGDYIDRGPDSKGVIDLLLAIKDEIPEVVFLKGNHEDMLLSFLGYPGNMGEVYLFNGGKEFFASYGLKQHEMNADALEALPKAHLSFFLNLESYVGLENYVFAHAGLDPLRDLASQLDSDLFWIRDAFIANIHRFEKVVIFGHTPYHEVMFDLPYKIGIDTGLVYGNKLSCLELVNKEIFQIDYGDKKVKKKSFPESILSGMRSPGR